MKSLFLTNLAAGYHYIAQIGNFKPKIILATARSPNWRFLAQKTPKKKYGSKCLELSNSSRNAIKKFLASMEVTEAGEAAEAENFPKKSMAKNA